MDRLVGKRVVITGGSTGIGAAIAKRFLEEAAQVAVWCRNPDNAKAIKKDLPGLADVACVDVAQAAEVDDAFEQSLAALGGLDVMICNGCVHLHLTP